MELAPPIDGTPSMAGSVLHDYASQWMRKLDEKALRLEEATARAYEELRLGCLEEFKRLRNDWLLHESEFHGQVKTFTDETVPGLVNQVADRVLNAIADRSADPQLSQGIQRMFNEGLRTMLQDVLRDLTPAFASSVADAMPGRLYGGLQPPFKDFCGNASATIDPKAMMMSPGRASGKFCFISM